MRDLWAALVGRPGIVELLYQRLADAKGHEAKALHALEKVAAERDELRAKLQISVGRECNALCLDLERDRDQMRAAVVTFLAGVRVTQLAVDDGAAALRRALGVTDE